MTDLKAEIARLRPHYQSNTATDQARRQLLDHFEKFAATHAAEPAPVEVEGNVWVWLSRDGRVRSASNESPSADHIAAATVDGDRIIPFAPYHPSAAPTGTGPFDLGEFEELPNDTLLSLRIASGPMTGTEIDTVTFSELRWPATPTDNTALVEALINEREAIINALSAQPGWKDVARARLRFIDAALASREAAAQGDGE